MYCNNYREEFNICLPHIKFSQETTPYTNEITGEHQCGFRRNRSATYLAFGNYFKRSGITITRHVNY